jgi:hypothetical protein
MREVFADGLLDGLAEGRRPERRVVQAIAHGVRRH